MRVSPALVCVLSLSSGGALAQDAAPPSNAWTDGTSKIGTLRTLTGHKSWARSLAYTPDGKTLISGSASRKIKLWRMPGGEELATLSAHS